MPRTESHTHLGVRLNVRRELKRLQRDPLEHFLKVAYPDHTIGTPRHRYENSYELYRVAMERALEQVSTAVRYRKGPYYVRKYGGTYGTRQRLLAQKHRRLERFLELDITTALLHARILLDRTVALSRVFLKGSRLPSFSSFNAHKKFFQKPDHGLSGHVEYADYIATQTAWFDVGIKYIRDKFVVHSGPAHWKLFSVPWEGDDLVMMNVLVRPKEGEPVGREGFIQFNVLQMSYDIEAFLRWFGRYGLEATRGA